MKILIDMNLSPDWVNYFAASGIEAIHWSRVGSAQVKHIALSAILN
jgi:predicted nuclease of predicted toxin-antitoxin system